LIRLEIGGNTLRVLPSDGVLETEVKGFSAPLLRRFSWFPAVTHRDPGRFEFLRDRLDSLSVGEPVRWCLKRRPHDEKADPTGGFLFFSSYYQNTKRSA
jgi:hypothetical protein